MLSSCRWNGKSCSWMLTCVTFHLSLVSDVRGSRISAVLLCLSSFSWFTSTRYWLCLWSSLIADSGNMSIQASLKRFKSSEKLGDPLGHLDTSSSCSIIMIKYPEEQTLSAFDEVGSQRILEILESIFCTQRFSIGKSFVHFCISDKCILQCWPSFFFFKHCKVQPIVNQILILEPWSWPIKKVVEFSKWFQLELSIDQLILRDMLQP